MPVSKHHRRGRPNSARRRMMNTVKGYKKWLKSPKRLYDPLLEDKKKIAEDYGLDKKEVE